MKLKTKKLILRDLKKGDEKDIIENLNNLKVSKFLGVVPYPYTIRDARWFVNESLKESKKKKRIKYEMGIESYNKIIGVIGLTKINEYNKTATLGYWLGEKYWRKGIIGEASKAILDFAFYKLKLRRIEISASPKNKASNALIKKLGFTFEGMRRKGLKIKSTGQIRDQNFYGLLKSEWIKARRKLK